MFFWLSAAERAAIWLITELISLPGSQNLLIFCSSYIWRLKAAQMNKTQIKWFPFHKQDDAKVTVLRKCEKQHFSQFYLKDGGETGMDGSIRRLRSAYVPDAGRPERLYQGVGRARTSSQRGSFVQRPPIQMWLDRRQRVKRAFSGRCKCNQRTIQGDTNEPWRETICEVTEREETKRAPDPRFDRTLELLFSSKSGRRRREHAEI